MENKLPQHKKLTVLVRVESGCLGPQGTVHVDKFCVFAQSAVSELDAEFIHWQIEPRNDKGLPEMEYKAMNKSLTHSQADKYLQMFDKNLDDFECHINDMLMETINHYFGR